MTPIGSVKDCDELRGLSSGKFDVVLVREQKNSVPLSSYIYPNGGIFVWDKNAEDSDDGRTIICPVSNPPKGRWKRLFDDPLSVKWFGAKGDMKGISGHDKGRVSVSGSDVFLKANESVFTPDEDGDKKIVIWDGNVNTRKQPLVTTIKEVIDFQKVKLKDPPTYSMDKEMSFAWGTDDTDAIQKTLDAAKETGLAVYLPPGHFVVT